MKENTYNFIDDENVVAVKLNKGNLEDLQDFLNSIEDSLVELIRQQVYQEQEARQETICLWLQTKDQADTVKDMLSFNAFKTATNGNNAL